MFFALEGLNGLRSSSHIERLSFSCALLIDLLLRASQITCGILNFHHFKRFNHATREEEKDRDTLKSNYERKSPSRPAQRLSLIDPTLDASHTHAVR